MSGFGDSGSIGGASVDLVLNSELFDQQLAEAAAQADTASSTISEGLQVEPGLDTTAYDGALQQVASESDSAATAISEGLQVEPGLDTATYDAALDQVASDSEAAASVASDAMQVEASVDTSSFEEGLSELESSAESAAEAGGELGGAFTSVGSTISNAMGEAGSAVSGLVEAGIDKLGPQIARVAAAAGPVGAAIAGAAAAATAAIGGAVHATQDWATGVRQLQTVTGLTAEEASALAGAGSELGLTVDQLTSGFGLLAKAIVNGSTGLEQYGIETRDAAGEVLPFQDVLANISDKFLTLPEGPERAAFAMNVFGRSGRALIPILAQGSAGLAELEQKARDAGLVMSQEDVDASKALTVSQRELGAAFKGVAIQLGEVFIPAVTGLVKAFGVALRVVMTWGKSVGAQFSFLGRIFKPVLTALGNAFKAVGAAWGDFVAAFGDLFAEIGDALGPLLPYIERFLALLAAAPLLIFVQALEGLAQGLEFAARATAVFMEWIGPKLQAAVDASVAGINYFIAGLNVLIDGINHVIDASNLLIGTHFDHIGAINALIPPTVDLTNATEDEATANEDAATAITSHTAAMRQHRLAQLQALGGLLGLVTSLRTAADAQREYARLTAQGKRGTDEWRDAQLAALQATNDFRVQVREFAASHPALSFDQMRDRLKEMAHQAGISGHDLRDAIGGALDDIQGKLKELNNQRVTLRVDTSQIDYAQAHIDRLQQQLQRIGT